MQLLDGAGAHFIEHRHAFAAAIHDIEHQAMQMDVEIGRGTEALDQGDRARVGFGWSDDRSPTGRTRPKRTLKPLE